ncbi:MAG: ACT domain-containing protein [Ruminococcaceae bacterium]|nr:ACT domain-containing protein [Oscillospiraceae bacterium]MBQ8896975.1 ACT domain-containing protein [Clostridia bacterium]
MRAVITVVGKDAVGIIAEVSNVMKNRGVNIIDISQSVLSDMFAMVMMTDISACTVPFGDFAEELRLVGVKLGLDIHAMHEDIFNSMHRV